MEKKKKPPPSPPYSNHIGSSFCDLPLSSSWWVLMPNWCEGIQSCKWIRKSYAKRTSYHIVSLWHVSLLWNFCTQQLCDSQISLRHKIHEVPFATRWRCLLSARLKLIEGRRISGQTLRALGLTHLHKYGDKAQELQAPRHQLNPNYALYISPPVDLHMCYWLLPKKHTDKWLPSSVDATW